MTIGWTNEQTASVASFITDRPRFYKLAIACKNYDKFVQKCAKQGVYDTPEGVSLTDVSIDKAQLRDIWELFLDEVS